MQIREITLDKKSKVNEAIGDIGTAAGQAVNVVRNIGGAIASPFKDIAQGYRSARQDQKINALADKAFRVWQNYVKQVEQSVAKGAAPAASKTADQTQPTPGATTPTATTPTTGATTPTATTPTTGASATTATTPTTAAAKTTPNYNALTGAGAKVIYNQPIGIPKTTTPQPANAVGPKTPGVNVTTPASTAPGQPITVGGQKLKPGTPEYEKLAKTPIRQTESDELKELQSPATPPSPALVAFRDRSDGKYESYLRAFVQKNLLAGMGSRELVSNPEIEQAIKEISKPENADPVKQRPLWNDLVRATSLAAPTARSLTDRTGKGVAGAETSGTTATTAAEKPGATAAGPTMTKDQISQWISRNSEDRAALTALLAAINSAGKA